VELAGSQVVGFGFVIELLALQGRSKLPDIPIMSLVQY
jgi:adenine phosphoribosyltransferase